MERVCSLQLWVQQASLQQSINYDYYVYTLKVTLYTTIMHYQHWGGLFHLNHDCFSTFVKEICQKKFDN